MPMRHSERVLPPSPRTASHVPAIVFSEATAAEPHRLGRFGFQDGLKIDASRSSARVEKGRTPSRLWVPQAESDGSALRPS